MDLQAQVALQLKQLSISAEPIIVAVSGGKDSVVLLHTLNALLPAQQLHITHLNHLLRGDDAENNAAFVEALAHSLDAPFHGIAIDIALAAAQSGQSVETAGRNARYAFFNELAQAIGASWVMTGHHADDQLETVVMNLTRGSGLAGLRGMAAVSALPTGSASDVQLVRPLLAVTRAQIDAYANLHNLAFVTDASNEDASYLRNQVRLQIVPQLKAVNPRVVERVFAMTQSIDADLSLLDALTAALFEKIAVASTNRVVIQRDSWRAQPLALRRRLLRSAASHVGIDQRELSFTVLEHALGLADSAESNKKADLSGGWQLNIEKNALSLTNAAHPTQASYPQLDNSVALPLDLPATLALGQHWQLRVERLPHLPKNVSLAETDPYEAYVQLPEAAQLFVRGRIKGERMRPLGLGGSKKVKAIMSESGVVQEFRPKWPIVATETYAIWIVGHTLDERAQVIDPTKPLLHLVVEPL